MMRSFFGCQRRPAISLRASLMGPNLSLRGWLLASLTGLVCMGPAMARQPVVEARVLLAQGGAYSNLGGNMAGYVINSETNMNRIYTQKLNQDLLNPGNQPVNEEPVIQYVGPPPQAPPVGPLFERSTQARPLLPHSGPSAY